MADDDIDPYDQVLADALSGNTETASSGEEDSDTSVSEEETLTVSQASSSSGQEKEGNSAGADNSQSLEETFRVQRMLAAMRDRRSQMGDVEGAASFDNIIADFEVGVAAYHGVSLEDYQARYNDFMSRADNAVSNSNSPENSENTAGDSQAPADNSAAASDKEGKDWKQYSGIEGGFMAFRMLEAIRDSHKEKGEDVAFFDNILADMEVGMAAYHGVQPDEYRQMKEDFYHDYYGDEKKTQEAEDKTLELDGMPEDGQEKVQEQEAETEKEEAPQEQEPEKTEEAEKMPEPEKASQQEAAPRELNPTNDAQAQELFKNGTVGNLDIHDLAGLQLAMEQNPGNFSDAQRQQVQDQAWGKIKDVAKGKDKLGKDDLKGFDSLLKHVPITNRREGTSELDTVKDAEHKLYNAQNGIEEKSFGEKAREGMNNLKEKGKEGFGAIKEAGKAGMSSLKDKGAKVLTESKAGLKNAFKSGLSNMGHGVHAIGSVAKERLVGFKDRLKEKIKNKIKENSFVQAFMKGYRIGKKVAKGAKKVGRFAYKAGKVVYKGVKGAAKLSVKGYQGAKTLAGKIKGKPTDMQRAVKFSKKDLNKLTPEQIKFAYGTLRDVDQRNPEAKEARALFRMTAFADKKMDEINNNKNALNADNAMSSAQWLAISNDVQDKVNHNQVEEKNKRNKSVAERLGQYGIDTKSLTIGEKQEAAKQAGNEADAKTQEVQQAEDVTRKEQLGKEAELMNKDEKLYQKYQEGEVLDAVDRVDEVKENQTEEKQKEENKKESKEKESTNQDKQKDEMHSYKDKEGNFHFGTQEQIDKLVLDDMAKAGNDSQSMPEQGLNDKEKQAEKPQPDKNKESEPKTFDAAAMFGQPEQSTQADNKEKGAEGKTPEEAAKQKEGEKQPQDKDNKEKSPEEAARQKEAENTPSEKDKESRSAEDKAKSKEKEKTSPEQAGGKKKLTKQQKAVLRASGRIVPKHGARKKKGGQRQQQSSMTLADMKKMKGGRGGG